MNKRTVSILTFLTLVIMIALLGVFVRSQVAINRAEDEAIALVSYDHKVKSVNDFYWTTTDQAVFTMEFLDDQGQAFYAIIEREGGNIHYYPVEDLINEADAKAITASEIKNPKILQARLGLYEGQPAWEMTIKNQNQTITYYLLSAETGEWLQTISNI